MGTTGKAPSCSPHLHTPCEYLSQLFPVWPTYVICYAAPDSRDLWVQKIFLHDSWIIAYIIVCKFQIPLKEIKIIVRPSKGDILQVCKAGSTFTNQLMKYVTATALRIQTIWSYQLIQKSIWQNSNSFSWFLKKTFSTHREKKVISSTW